MMKKVFLILPFLTCLCMGGAHANWEYASEYVAGGWYNDDGSRFVLSVRGGAAYGMAKIENDIGELVPGYYYDPGTFALVSDGYKKLSCGTNCDSYAFAGYANIGDLHAKNDFKKMSFAAGASVGWVIPNASNWRLELGWDRITETDYNSSPLFDGDVVLYGGALDGYIANIQSGAVHSTVSTDIISAMAFYDFFDGINKPMRTLIPYVGFGLGYANSTTEMQLVDSYGDLSLSAELIYFGEGGGDTILEFYKSKTETSNIAGVLAVGASYGITDKMFIDFGARFMYIPEIKWSLSNESDTRHRDWFSAKNMIYTNLMLGLRVEF
ncbi:MAG: hypothetical protein J5679_01250 [Alphaproteobacteria bacterium]|nr:hypothetical protein [Alphaproteobacteria bacterium]